MRNRLAVALSVVALCLAASSGFADAPRIFSSTTMLEPNTVLGPAMEAQMEIALCAGGGQFMAAWKDARRQDYGFHGTAFRTSLFFGRVRADGTVLDPVGVQLGEGPHDGYPAISYNGVNFLVVWQIGRYYGYGYDLHACRVSPDGVILDGLDGFVVAASTNDDWKPAVASDGADWFVVWQNCGSDDPSSRIYGTKITASGGVVTPGGARLCQQESTQLRPTVAWTGSRYMVAFHDKRNDVGDIYALRVQADGTVLDPDGFLVCAATGEQGETSIAPLGAGTALIAWEDSRDPGTGRNIYAARVSDPPIGPAISIVVCDVTADQRFPKVGAFAGNWVIAWQDYRSPLYGAYAARVRPNGFVVDPDGFPVGSAVTYQWMPCVAADSTTCLFGWAQGPASHETAYDAFGRRFDTNMQPIEPQPFPICQAAPDQGRIDIARTNAGFMTVFEDSATDPWDPDLYVAPLDADGQFTPAGKIPLSLEPEWEMAAAIAFDGTNCLVAWSNRKNDEGDVLAARVTQQGQILDNPPIPVCVQPGFQIPVCLAYGGGEYLAAWEDFRSGTYRQIYAARITPAGTVLDPNGFQISAASPDSSAMQPRVAWNGTTFLVTWWESAGDQPPYIATRIMARFINPANAQSSPPAFVVESAENPKWVECPVVDWSGTDHLVAWEHCPGEGSLRHVAGKRILPDGTILDPLPIEISSAGDNSWLALAWNGSAHVVLWRSTQSNGRIGGYLARVLDTGEVIDPGGMRAFDLCLNDPACNADPQLRISPRGDGRVLLFHTSFEPSSPYGADRLFGNWFTPPELVDRISAARTMPENSLITVAGKTVTAGTNDFAGVFYVEEADRSSGMRVLWTESAVPRGMTATESGLVKTVGGERVIEAQAVALGGAAGNALTPLGLINRSLGGCSPAPIVPGIPGAIGLYNIGVLVRAWGRVTEVRDDWFYIDDGTGFDDGSGNKGIKVTVAGLAGGTGFALPEENDYVLVTGISSCEIPEGKTDPIRLLRLRSPADLQNLGE